jgi:N-acetylmuramate 1-kinase
LSSSKFQKLNLEGESQTQVLAARMALWVRPGMVVRLHGDLGSGKSTFARAFIRALLLTDKSRDIPSPSFSLVQSYDDARVPVFHADLYRLQSAQDVDELGLPGLLKTHCGLVEWPDLFETSSTPDILNITFSGRGDNRMADLAAHGQWASALRRDDALQTFLDATPFRNATRIFFEGDASSRRYEVLQPTVSDPALLMDMPQRPDGPIVKHGKPYSAIAHLAEGITAVVAINTHLVAEGYSAPRIWHSDLDQGFAIIEPLGDQVYGRMMLQGHDMHEPLEAATAVLADMATKTWPTHPTAAPGVTHVVPAYDRDAQLIEVDLLPSWFFPHAYGRNATSEQAQGFAALWQTLLPLADAPTPQWVIRDFHSPNLIWIPERNGLQRVGIIDSQDAVMGHAAYDLVSMAQDARVDIAPELEKRLIDVYCQLRADQGHFNRHEFETAYAILGAQRATKILGIFARLNTRDGKPAYLRHIPRVQRYLAKNLKHPALHPLWAWFHTHAPEALGEAP